jgi:hypothetical protein
VKEMIGHKDLAMTHSHAHLCVAGSLKRQEKPAFGPSREHRGRKEMIRTKKSRPEFSPNLLFLLSFSGRDERI